MQYFPMQIKKPMVKFEVPREDQIAPPCVEAPEKSFKKAKPMYSKPMWHNCNKCRAHYASDAPHLRAYVCEKCWKSMPHYRTTAKLKKVPAEYRWPLEYILLYIFGCSLCLLVTAYYLWVD